jgi:predicted nucleic acid-binding protein
MNALLDVNVVLDMFLLRQPWLAEAGAIWEANRAGRITAYLSSASMPTIFYVIRKQLDQAHARIAVAESLRSLTILPVGRTTLELALVGTGTDFEDNLQIACAVEAGLDAIVTRDLKGFAGSTVAVLTPAELLARISKAPHA